MSDINLVCKDTILVSYPKSGRTWLRMMLAKILKDTGIDTDKNEMILCTHKNCNDIYKDYGKEKRIVLLIRDPGDVIVSQFHELKVSKPWQLAAPNTTISQFIRGGRIEKINTRHDASGIPLDKSGQRRHGINSVIDWMGEWFADLKNIKEHKIITYEEMKKDTFSVLKEVVEFVGYECDDEHIRAAVEYSSFSNMRKIEEEQIENSNGLGLSLHKLKKHGNKENPNLLRKYKGNFGKSKQATRVRRGKVRGYLDELSESDIAYINDSKKYLLHLPLKLILRGAKY